MNKIKLITDESFFPDLTQSIHYISWTPYNPMSITNYSQMSWVDLIIRKTIPNIKPEEFYSSVDYSSETGTFYPQANITIMPSFRQPYSDEEIYHHFNDAIKAQNMYIHATNIIFDMRNYSYINPHTNEVDNKEYLEMIYHNHRQSSILLRQDIFTYVIMLQDEVDKLNKIYFEIASEQEVNNLKIMD